MADCPGCGGTLRYDIPSQRVICDFCRQEYDPEALDTTQLAEVAENDEMGVQEFHCPNCGGDLFSTDRDVTGVCSYCGSRVVFESRLVSKKRPQLIIPFRKTKDECKQIYGDYLKGKLFVPKELRDPEYIESFRGIYMPYWISDVSQKGPVRFYAHESRDQGKLVIADTWRVGGELDAEYDHFYHDGGSAFSDDLSEKLEPYQMYDENGAPLAKPFYPAYLSGFYAEPADLDFAQYETYFKDLADRQTEEYLDTAKPPKSSVDHDYASYPKLDLLPPLNQAREDQAALEIAGQNGAGNVDSGRLHERNRLEKLREEQLEEASKQRPQEKKPLTAAEAYGYETEQKDSMALFPVWFMAWRKKDRVAYLTINGQTGKVCADLPIDYLRFFGIFAIIAVILYGVFSLFTLNVYMMPVLAAWLSAVVLHMQAKELETILERSAPVLIHKTRQSKWGSAQYGILGLVVVAVFPLWRCLITYFTENEATATGPFFRTVYVFISLVYAVYALVHCLQSWFSLPRGSRTLPVFLLDAATAVFCLFVVLTNSPVDTVMYGCSAAAFLTIAVTLLDMIRQFNLSATRPLPQFEHRGGDDDA